MLRFSFQHKNNDVVQGSSRLPSTDTAYRMRADPANPTVLGLDGRRQTAYSVLREPPGHLYEGVTPGSPEVE